MPFYEQGNVRIRYEVAGSGFPLLVGPNPTLTLVANSSRHGHNDFWTTGSRRLR